MDGTVNVFLLAENRLLREALAKMMKKKADVCVVGDSAYCLQALEQIVAAGPDVLVLDSAMYLADQEFLQEIRRLAYRSKVVDDWHGLRRSNFPASNSCRRRRVCFEGRLGHGCHQCDSRCGTRRRRLSAQAMPISVRAGGPTINGKFYDEGQTTGWTDAPGAATRSINCTGTHEQRDRQAAKSIGTNY